MNTFSYLGKGNRQDLPPRPAEKPWLLMFLLLSAIKSTSRPIQETSTLFTDKKALPIASICKWGYDQTQRIAQIFITIFGFCCNHSHYYILLLPVVSQLRNPLEVIQVCDFVFNQFCNHITSCRVSDRLFGTSKHFCCLSLLQIQLNN